MVLLAHGRGAAVRHPLPRAVPEDGSPLPGEQVLLDDNVEAEGHEFFSLGSFDVTADGSTLLYGVDVEGDERYTIRLRSLDGPGRVFDDEIPGTAAGALFDQVGAVVKRHRELE